MTKQKEQPESKQEKVLVTQEEIDGLKIVFQNAKQNALDRNQNDNLSGIIKFEDSFIQKLEKLKNCKTQNQRTMDNQTMTNERLKQNLQEITVHQSLNVFKQLSVVLMHPDQNVCGQSGNLIDSEQEIAQKVNSLQPEEIAELNETTNFWFLER